MISHKEEEFVFLHGAAESSAKLVLVQRRFRRTRHCRGIKEIVVSVEGSIPEKFKRAAVKIVGAGLGDDVDVGAGIAAVACIVVRSLNLELLNGVRIGSRKRA